MSDKYTLYVSADIGSQITVTRTFSNNANNSILSDGDAVYVGDKLKIVFASEDGYFIERQIVNSETFTSGNTHTVSGDVYVSTECDISRSIVSATDAYVGGVSLITVSKRNSKYFHSLQYTFMDKVGYISNIGYDSETEEKFSESAIEFLIPQDFYDELGENTSGTCRIVCRTYESKESNIVIGDPSYTDITIKTSSEGSSPIVTGKVEDVNDITTALTGSSSILVRFISDVRCTINATAQNSATILSTRINSKATVDNICTFDNVSNPTFTFYAVDSRGNSTTEVVTVQMVDYVKLTLHPVVSRLAGDNNKITLSFTGKFFNGSFGQHSNTLSIKYRYRKTGEQDVSEWKTIDSDKYAIATSSYKTETPIVLTDSFEYETGYIFEVCAEDGGNGEVLSSVTKTIAITGGVPMFDYGESGFNFNIPITYRETALFDIIYPIGTVYMSVNSELPQAMLEIGSWTPLDSQLESVYAWKRTS